MLPVRSTMTNIVVTFTANNEQRNVLTKIFDSSVRIVFLSDLHVEDRLKDLSEADVLFSWSPKREIHSEEYSRITKVRMLQLLSAGADHVPFSRLPSGLVIACNAGAYSEPMGEHVLAMILALAKNLLDRHNKLKRAVFEQSNVNRRLQGSNCTILGFGGVGKAAARLLRCFGVKIYAVNTTGKTTEPIEFIGTTKDLDHVLRLADIVVVALPLTNATRGLVGSRELALMKDNAILVNVARGQIVDEAALYQKLKTCPSFMAAIDAWWNEPDQPNISYAEFHSNYPFMELPNVLGSPHNSSIVPGIFPEATKHAAENIKRFCANEEILGKVNPRDYQ
jgi:phosphoglycerate dehydrogenase-like enzyme